MTAIKLDENLGIRFPHRSREAGHDAESVRSEGLNGAEDSTLFEHCRAEQRTLITLDMDFSNPLRFPPPGTAGTIILRAHRPSPAEIDLLFDEALHRLAIDSVQARIWIIEPGRVRIYRSWDSGEGA
jgi:predicted nuclease of predicted toxin-antitoxin system